MKISHISINRRHYYSLFAVFAILVLVFLSANNQDIIESIFYTGELSNATPLANGSVFKCVTAAVTNLKFPMCVYTASEDRHISRSVLKGGYFEEDLVTKIVELFRRHEDVTFVDLGANLGTYSLPVSHLGGRSVAVEPNPETYRRLERSIQLGRIGDRMDALNVAIANGSSKVPLHFDRRNRWNTFLSSRENSEACGSSCMTTETRTLDSLLPLIRNRKVIMKVDTQESEIKIFTEQSAGRFFESVDVLMVLMEWHFYPQRYGWWPAKRRMVDEFLKFFYSRGYVVYDPRGERELATDWYYWNNDIVFKKATLPSENLFSIGS